MPCSSATGSYEICLCYENRTLSPGPYGCMTLVHFLRTERPSWFLLGEEQLGVCIASGAESSLYVPPRITYRPRSWWVGRLYITTFGEMVEWRTNILTTRAMRTAPGTLLQQLYGYSHQQHMFVTWKTEWQWYMQENRYVSYMHDTREGGRGVGSGHM